MPATAPWGFNRSSVVDQACMALREAIRTGELRDPLPGGHLLAQRLGISRPSVQAALRRLAAEGIVVIKKCHRCRLAKKFAARASAAHPGVCVVCPVPSESMDYGEHPLLLEMHAEFASRGIGWEVVIDRKLGGKLPERRLSRLVSARPKVTWILFGTRPPIQEWFVKAGVSAVVLGSCGPELGLPSADLNYEAVGWHAAGMVVRQGHNNIGLILPPDPLPGDRASRLGFLRYAERRAPTMKILDWHIPDHPGQRSIILNRLLSGPSRPTVLISLRPALTIAVVTQVLASGLRIPEDISIVSRDTHPLLDSALPHLTRYRSTFKQLAMRAVRLALGQLAGRQISPRPSLVTPTFFAGTTLARCDVSPVVD
jgi:hypothetical protein